MREISFYDIDYERLHVVCLGTETMTEGYIGAAKLASFFADLVKQLNYVFPRIMRVRSLASV